MITHGAKITYSDSCGNFGLNVLVSQKDMGKRYSAIFKIEASLCQLTQVGFSAPSFYFKVEVSAILASAEIPSFKYIEMLHSSEKMVFPIYKCLLWVSYKVCVFSSNLKYLGRL